MIPSTIRAYLNQQIATTVLQLQRLFIKCRQRQGQQVISSLLIAAILAQSLIPLAQASPPRRSPWRTTSNELCAAPVRTNGQPKIFLPLLMRGVSNTIAAISFLDGDADKQLQTVEAQTRTLAYQPNKVYTYLYDYGIKSQTMSRNREGSKSEPEFSSRVNTYADITILDKTTDGTIDAQLVLREPYVCNETGSGEQTVAEDAEFLQQLATPIRFKQAENGTIVEVLSQPNLPTSVTNIQKGILNFLQVTLQDNVDTYMVQETGGQGIYNAHYLLNERTDGLHITKTISTGDFQQMVTKGDQIESLQVNTTLQMLVGSDEGVLTSVTVVEDNMSADGTKDPANVSENGADGLSVWSTAKTNGSFVLQTVTDAPANAKAVAKSMEARYAVDTIFGELDGEYNNNDRIDLATVDLAAEFNALEAAPDNPDLFMRILELVKADSATVVIDMIGQRLQLSIDNPQISQLYIDLLGTIGTPHAQDYLNGLFNNASFRSANIAASTTITHQQQALVNIVTLTKPATQTVATLRQLSSDAGSELQPIAVRVLGAAADEIDDYDPELQDEILGEIEDRLEAADNVDDVILYLEALGNIGDELSVEVIEPFLYDTIGTVIIADPDDLADIRIAAYEALRGIPAQEAEDLLIAALFDETLALWERDIIADILIDRDFDDETILSDEAAEALDEYIDLYLDEWDDDYDEDEWDENGQALRPVQRQVPEGSFARNWNRNFGNQNVGIRLPGSIYAAYPPESNGFGGGLYFQASQRIDAYVWRITPNYNVASASVSSRRNGGFQQVRANVTLLNNSIRVPISRDIPCNSAIPETTLLNKHLTIFKVGVTIPLFGIIPITFSVEAGGAIRLTYAAQANVCDVNNQTISATIRPYASVAITGSIYVNLWLVQGGASLRGHIMRTSLPTTGSIQFVTNVAPQFCLNVQVAVEPLALRFFLWVRYWLLGWKTKEWTVAQYSFATYTYPVYNFCTPF